MNNLKSTVLDIQIGVITSLLILIMMFTLGILLNVRNIEFSLMNTACTECQCREIPDGK